MADNINPYQAPKAAISTGHGIKIGSLTAMALSGVLPPQILSVCETILQANRDSERLIVFVIAHAAIMLVCLLWWCLAMFVIVLHLFWKSSRSAGMIALGLNLVALIPLILCEYLRSK